MKKEKNNYYQGYAYLAIVAVVAIVAVFALVGGNGAKTVDLALGEGENMIGNAPYDFHEEEFVEITPTKKTFRFTGFGDPSLDHLSCKSQTADPYSVDPTKGQSMVVFNPPNPSIAIFSQCFYGEKDYLQVYTCEEHKVISMNYECTYGCTQALRGGHCNGPFKEETR